MRKKILFVLSFLLLLVLALLAGGWWWATRPFPQVSGTLQLDGLDGPVEVRRDEWGVPHLYASTLHDLYFAQGVVHAQDRLWQMDFQRRVGLGRLSELLGEPTVETDKFLRTIGVGAAAQRDWEAAKPETRAALQAYSDGVNAYMATDPTLPLEYQLLGAAWEPWEPAHSLAWAKMMQWDLNGNWREELLRASLVERLGEDTTALLLQDGTVVGAASPTTLRVAPSALERDSLTARLLFNQDVERGSNAWVIGGERTATGRPILENDPHLGPGMPSLWYEIGLHGPDMDVVGASLPGAPAVVIGHNAQIAWGVTNLATDTQDLFTERLSDAGDAYEWQGEMLPLTVRQERIAVKGGEDILLEVKETRHGPLLNEVVEGLSEPVAFQWYATQTPSHLTDAILALNAASDRDSFLAALRQWDSPAQNFVYADTSGTIGYVATGALPIRPAAGGMLPQPGWSGEWEWEGTVPFDELPQRWGPSEHFLVTANDTPFPDDFPVYTGTDWAAPFRATRIRQLIEAGDALTPDDVEAMQRDVLSLPAQQIVPLLVALPSDDIIVQRAQEQLASWDERLAGELPGAGIYEVTYGFIVREMLADDFGSDEAGTALLDRYLNNLQDHAMLTRRLLEQPEHPLWDDGRTPARETRDDILRPRLDRHERVDGPPLRGRAARVVLGAPAHPGV